ncbi:uncharacterized protein [Spinacia oleracea]|uniref:Retrotransposon gag domain-containing protein n=1 Tax=Spinacia oleracea TaxID=3562 RepID=A0A9R0IX64_SPIOL|nr:uncharacterized protein LOC110796523 [Spinacia oleracea]
MADSTKFHSTLNVSNVKSLITITLDMETAQYHSWATLFKVQAKVHQWIYGTVSHDILQSILVLDDVAADAWKRVEQIFLDNQNARDAYLETKFTTTTSAQFTSVIEYYTRLKSLADQLGHVGAPVSDTRLVLRLLAGLPASYKHFVTTIQQKSVLPKFSEACSRLKLGISTNDERDERDADSSALVSVDDAPSHSPPPPPSHNNHHSHGRHNNNGNYRGKNNGKGNNNNRGKNNNNNNRGKGGRGGQNSGGQQPVQQ